VEELFVIRIINFGLRELILEEKHGGQVALAEVLSNLNKYLLRVADHLKISIKL
jgi:hypothetical protein